jgi:hypothetical protein
VELSVLAPVESLVTRWLPQDARQESDDERRLVSLEEPLRTRRIDAQAHPAERLLEALDDRALQGREQEGNLVRVGDDLLVYEPTA